LLKAAWNKVYPGRVIKPQGGRTVARHHRASRSFDARVIAAEIGVTPVGERWGGGRPAPSPWSKAAPIPGSRIVSVSKAWVFPPELVGFPFR
jgi:hypothetical protein